MRLCVCVCMCVCVCLIIYIIDQHSLLDIYTNLLINK